MTCDELHKYDNYYGLTPTPPDFGEFWEKRMAEASAIPLEYEIKPSDFMPSNDSCLFYDLWFTGMKGAKIYAKYIRPNTREKLPLVLQFHGYPGASRSWWELSSFAGMGMAMIAMDCPGQGGRSEDKGGYKGTTVAGHIAAGLDGPLEDMYYVRLYQDIRILCRIARELDGIDAGKVFVNGASQGGGQGIACAALNPDLINRAAILYPFLSDYRMVYALGADDIAYEGIRYYARWYDPDGERENEWFGKLAYIDGKNFAPMIRCPVLFGTGLDDTVCPPQTQCAVYNGLDCPKKRYLFPGFGHVEIQEFDDLMTEFFCRAEPEFSCGTEEEFIC